MLFRSNKQTCPPTNSRREERARLEMAPDDLHRQWCSTTQGYANQMGSEKKETKRQISKDWSEEREHEKQGVKGKKKLFGRWYKKTAATGTGGFVGCLPW